MQKCYAFAITRDSTKGAEGVGFEPTADVEHDGGLHLLGIGDIRGNKKACRCSYFGSYSSHGEFMEASEISILVGMFHSAAIQFAG